MASQYVTVFDRKRKHTREITRHAFQLLPDRYELINGSAPQQPQKKSGGDAATVPARKRGRPKKNNP